MRKPPPCNGQCGKQADRGILVVLPADFDPAKPAAVLRTYAPDSQGDGDATANWTNTGIPPGKATPLDCDLSRLVRPTEGRKGFAFVAVELANRDLYFDRRDALETDDANGDKFLREPRILKNGRRLVFKVRLVEPALSRWIDYDLFVTRRSDGLRIKVDPKVRNTG